MRFNELMAQQVSKRTGWKVEWKAALVPGSKTVLRKMLFINGRCMEGTKIDPEKLDGKEWWRNVDDGEWYVRELIKAHG